jgi:hypothetical protein
MRNEVDSISFWRVAEAFFEIRVDLNASGNAAKREEAEAGDDLFIAISTANAVLSSLKTKFEATASLSG